MYVRAGDYLDFLKSTWRRQLAILVIAVVMTALELHVLRGRLSLPPLVVSVLGTALAFFIGFLNNQAYDRWWEARKIWGAFVNDSRNFALMVQAYFEPPESTDSAPDQREAVVQLQQRLVQLHIAFLKATVLRLRGRGEPFTPHLSEEERITVKSHGSAPVAIALLQREGLAEAARRGYVDPFRLTMINRMLDNFMDDLGKAERIKTTVFPLGHVYLTQASLWLFVILLPATLAALVGYWAILFTWVLGFLYVLTFNAGQAIVDPFEDRPSDTPIATITRTIEINMLDVVGDAHGLDALATFDGGHKM